MATAASREKLTALDFISAQALSAERTGRSGPRRNYSDRSGFPHGKDKALAMRNGVALFVAPGRVPVRFDHEGVSQVIGELAGQSPV